MVRVTGWGQDGPLRDKPGFGTLAEAFSGWAHLNGFPENPPTLPPMGLGDALTSVLGAYATMVALYERDVKGDGRGQVVDLAIYESLFSLIGQQVILYDRLGRSLSAWATSSHSSSRATSMRRRTAATSRWRRRRPRRSSA